MCSILISLLVVTFPSHISWVLTLMKSTKEFKPHARTNHIVIFVIIAMLILYNSMTSHATIILYHHTSMLTLQTSLISHALWLL
jgi:hypothetical protein